MSIPFPIGDNTLPDVPDAPPPDPEASPSSYDIGGLHPAIAQAIGLLPAQNLNAAAGPALTPPPLPQDVAIPGDAGPAFPNAGAPPPVAPPPPSSDTSPAERPPSVPGAAGDYQVPVSAIGKNRASPPQAGQPRAPRPMSPDQQLAQVDQRQAQADQASAQAIGDQSSVAQTQGAAELANYQAHDAEAKRIEAQRQAQQQEYTKTHAEKQAYVDSTLKSLDNYKIDQNKYWNDAGVGQHIGWYIAMALTGLGQALNKQNGPNPVIQMLQDKMHQSVVAQMDERDQLKERNARAEHALDKYDQYSQSREAQINLLDARNDKVLANSLLTTAAKYKSAQAQANAKSQAAQLMQDSVAKAQKSAEFAASYDTQKKQLAVSQANLGISQAELGLKRQEFDWQKDKEQQQLNLSAAKEALAEQKGITAKNKSLGVAAPTSDGSVGLLTDKDGTVHQFRSPEIAEKTTNMVAAAQTYNRLVQKMVQGIKDHGGESDWVKSDDWKRMTSDLQSATAELHDAYGITSFREPTVEFFEKMATSGVDPTSFIRNATAALENSNDNLHAKVNDKLHAAGYDGPDVAFAPTDAPAAAPSRIQQIETLIKARPETNPERARDAEFNATYRDTKDIAKAHLAGEQAAAAARSGKPNARQLAGIDELQIMAQRGGADAAAAVAALKDLVSKRKSDADRDNQLLNKWLNPKLAPSIRDPSWAGDPIVFAAQNALDNIDRSRSPSPATTVNTTEAQTPAYDPDALIKRFQSPASPTFPSR